MKIKNLSQVKFIFTFLLLALVGCQKEPNANFDTDKTNYNPGEVVVLTNTSTNGDSYKWKMPNGTYEYTKNASFQIPIDQEPGVLSFELTANNKSKTDRIIKTVTIVGKPDGGSSGDGTGTGNAMFWVGSDLGLGDITVTCNGLTGKISGYYSSSPSCGASKSANFSLSPGTYNFSAQAGSTNWSGTINVQEGGCSKMQLTYNSTTGGGTSSGGTTGGGTTGGGTSGGGTSTGDAMFWIASELGLGNITVTCNGLSRTISSYYSSSPSCGATNCANFSMSPGTYSYSAKAGTASWSGTINVTSGGCSKMQLTSSGNTGGGTSGGGTSTGNAMFWIASDLGLGNITVTCNGISRTISGYYGSSPSCGATNCANFSLSPGTYSYSAKAGTASWSGTINVTSGGCSKMQLTYSGNTGGGTSGGGTSTGNATFWVASDLGLGNITVTCNGISRTISSYYSSSPSCGATNCANFSMSPGTYSYSAKAGTATWNGSINVTSGGCSKMQLTR